MNTSRLIRLGSTAARIVTPLCERNYPEICTGVRNFHSSIQNKAKKSESLSSSATGSKSADEPGIIKRVLVQLPFFNIKKSKLMAAGYLLYEGIADKVNYLDFFTELELPDTFYSWFAVTELHIWMISARVMAEGDDGRLLRNHIVEALWADVAQRVKKLGAHNPSIARAQVAELSEQLQAALIAYDEGLLTDDVVLASALWRRFYQCEYVNPENLETLVKYVRKQMRSLDNISKDHLLGYEPVKWEPFTK